MSGTPKLLAPDTPVQEIARRMQRYGYEGYPVVQAGEILGLVTRRAVDRTLSHRLNLTAVGLMEAGNVHIAPGASIEELQTLMTNTGWGQIPVVDPEQQTIIGIVTRTDLLKTLAPKSTPPGKQNLASKLESALPPERLRLLKDIAHIAQKQRVALYIVGGFVRDLLLDYPSLDFDLVVEGDAIALAQSVGEKLGGRVTTHRRFGTAKWFLSAEHSPQIAANTGKNGLSPQIPNTLDFITARREFYSHPTALPTVERGSIKLDLHRRDFTINTLALRLDGHHYGELLDYWGGFNDLNQGLVRVLHSISFVDDPTRMLRAVRYEQRYGFQIGKRTLELLLQARPLMGRVSGDRIRHEVDNILNEDKAAQMLDRLHDVILSGGEKIYSSEVESVLHSHPQVSECAVVGVPDPAFGEIVTAVVRPREGCMPETDELLAHCRARIGGYKVPKDIRIVDSMPKSAMGKVLKHKLRDLFGS